MSVLLTSVGVWVWILALGNRGAGAVPKEEEVWALTGITCPPGHTALITEAYHRHQPDPPICDRDCRPVSKNDTGRCFNNFGTRCYGRVSLHDLNTIYAALDAGDGNKLSAVDRAMKEDIRRGDFSLKYLCLTANASAVVSPCHSDPLTTRDQGAPLFTSILVAPNTGSSESPCLTSCFLTPRGQGPQKVTIHLLTREEGRTRSSHVDYRFVFRDTAGPEERWITVTSTYPVETALFFHVRGLEVRFDLMDPSVITRLWVYLQGEEFSLTCGDGSPEKTENNKVVLSTPKAAPETSPPEPEETENNKVVLSTPMAATETSPPESDHEIDKGLLALYVLATFLGFAAGVGLAVHCIRKRRSADEAGGQPDTQATTVSVSDYDEIWPSTLPGQRVPTGSGPSSAQAQTETGRGNDDGEYVGLERGGKRNGKGAAGQGDLYDHALPQGNDHVADDAASRDADVYNHLHRQHQRQQVMDNVYDSTR